MFRIGEGTGNLERWQEWKCCGSKGGQDIGRGDRNGNVENQRGDKKFGEVTGMETLRL